MLSMLSVFLLSVCFQNAISLSSSNVKLEGNGYSGVLIAINPAVEENENLIDLIKETWTSASRDLYVATQHLAYFKEVTILLPRTWDSVDRDPVTGNENYNQADVIIAPENPSYGGAPYTIQYGGCGQQGMYSHFTPEYFMNATAVTNYGPRGKVVVHEWAHYRWGVFDETSHGEFPFYWDPNYDESNGPQATRCPSTMYGDVRDISSPNARRRCSLNDLDKVTNTYPSNCVFFPFEDQYYHPNASMMSYQFLDEVTTFCRDDGHFGEHNRHNIYAPNDQNRLCDLKSTWTVIMESDDFKDTTANHGIVDTTPIFKVVRPLDQRFVLVLDTSGSMSYGSVTTRSDALRKAAYQFVTISAPDDSWVGIVDFDFDAIVLSYLKKLDSTDAREDLAFLLPDDANGGTCIGCGIDAGIKVLEAFGDPAGGVLIVITDGEGSGVEDYYDEVLEKGIIVETIFIELEDSNELLAQLAIESGGNWYITADGEDIQQVFSEISAYDTSDTNSFQIQSTSFTLSRGETYSSTVLVDYTIGLETVFAFTWSYGSLAPYSVITSPSGCSYTNDPGSSAKLCSSGKIYTVSTDFQTIKFSIPGTAEVGKWIYSTSLASSSAQNIIASVTSAAASSSVEPIIVESGMSQTDVPDGSPVIVYAKVTQGYNPILGATVWAAVTRPSPPHVPLELLDNGAGADIRKNDGIYSRYFFNFTGTGRYSVEVEVSHKDSTGNSSGSLSPTSRANYRPGTISDDGSVSINPNGATPSVTGNPSSTDGVKSEDIGEFSRIVSSGAFSYAGTSATPPDLPPSQVNDLKVRQKDINDFSKGVVLEFTAPGGDEDQGRASRYEIRYTYGNPTTLTQNFTGAPEIQNSDIIQGNLTNPSLAGTLETFIVNTPSLPADTGSISLAIAIRAVDNVGNTGKASSPGTISFFITPPKTTEPPCTCEGTADCHGHSHGDHYILTDGCETYFYHCTHGTAVKKDCPVGLFFNPTLDVCDWSRNIPACEDLMDSTTASNAGPTTTRPKATTTTQSTNASTAKPSEDCDGHAHGDHYILTDGCETYFYQCTHGTAVKKDCPSGLYFNPTSDACDWGKNIPACKDSEDTTKSSTTTTTIAQHSTTTSLDESSGTEDCDGHTHGDLYITTDSCESYFYQCTHGLAVQKDCPSGLFFNPILEACDWGENIPACGGSKDTTTSTARPTTTTNPSGTKDCHGHANGDLYILTNGCEQSFYQCTHGSGVEKDCPTGLFFNPASNKCDWSYNIPACGGSKDTTTTSTTRPTTTIIPGTKDCNGHSEGDLYILTNGCEESFYQCTHGTGVKKDCPSGLYFNPTSNKCDWSYIIPACGGSKDTTTTSSTRLTTIDPHSTTKSTAKPPGAKDCDGHAEGDLYILTNGCEPSFYQCTHGTGVEKDCPSGLYFNPTSNVCDWGQNIAACGGSKDTTTTTSTTRPVTTSRDTRGTTTTAAKPSDPCVSYGDGSHAAGPCDATYYLCSNGYLNEMTCAPGTAYDPDIGGCNHVGQVPGCTSIDSVDCSDKTFNGFGYSKSADCGSGIYYVCENGKETQVTCPAGLVYNGDSRQCVSPDSVDCTDASIGTDSTGPTTTTTTTTTAGTTTIADTAGPGDEPASTTTTTTKDSSTDDPCVSYGDGSHAAGPCDATYYLCSDGYSREMTCAPGTAFDPDMGGCNHVGQVPGCTSIDSVDCSDNTFSGFGYSKSADCESGIYYVCKNGTETQVTCRAGLVYNGGSRQCVSPDSVDCTDTSIGTDSTGPTTTTTTTTTAGTTTIADPAGPGDEPASTTTTTTKDSSTDDPAGPGDEPASTTTTTTKDSTTDGTDGNVPDGTTPPPGTEVTGPDTKPGDPGVVTTTTTTNTTTTATTTTTTTTTTPKTSGKTYVGFVVDDTGSMSNEIEGVTEWIKGCVDGSITSCGDPPTGGWIVTSFNDPYVGTVVGPTLDSSEIIDAVNGYYAHGGGDCPEKAFTGLQNAVNVVPNEGNGGCKIYMFTDATATDDSMHASVTKKYQDKGCSFIPILTGCCGTCPDPCDSTSPEYCHDHITDTTTVHSVSKRSTTTYSDVQTLFFTMSEDTGGNIYVTEKPSSPEDMLDFLEEEVTLGFCSSSDIAGPSPDGYRCEEDCAAMNMCWDRSVSKCYCNTTCASEPIKPGYSKCPGEQNVECDALVPEEIFPDQSDCESYFQCNYATLNHFTCAEGTVFSENSVSHCDHPEFVEPPCGTLVVEP